jgi:hypothetical protein
LVNDLVDCLRADPKPRGYLSDGQKALANRRNAHQILHHGRTTGRATLSIWCYVVHSGRHTKSCDFKWLRVSLSPSLSANMRETVAP